MKKTGAVEIRNELGRLVAKYYPSKGVIEISQKGVRTIIVLPVGTPIRLYHRKEPSTK